MAFGKLGAMGRGMGHLGSLGALSASAGMPAAPAGYHWDFVIENGQQVTENGNPVVALVANGS
jgi:hypothetical protein